MTPHMSQYAAIDLGFLPLVESEWQNKPRGCLALKCHGRAVGSAIQGGESRAPAEAGPSENIASSFSGGGSLSKSSR